MQGVDQALVVGVGVHRGHQAVLDPERVVQNLHERRQTIRRARSVRDDEVLTGIELVFVDSQDEGGVGVLGGAEMMTRVAPASRCLVAFSRLVYLPVDSTTTSMPNSRHGKSFA